MSEVKINYYEVLKNTPMMELDEMNGFAYPIKNDKNKNWEINKGQYVKSFGTTKALKNTDKEKQTYLILVNGNGVLMNDVTLYKDEVDDCGCDGNPIAKPTDMDKVNEVKPIHNKLNEESAYINKTSKFDKSGIYGLVIGGVLLGLIVWFKTKDKKKALIGAAAGAFIGMLIGYFIGRRGLKKVETLSKLDQVEREANTKIQQVEPGASTDSDKQDFFQLGQTYDFSIPYPIYALVYENNSFYIAKDKEGNKAIIKPNGKVRGKLVEVKEPNIFIADASTKKVNKVKSKKPLPFLDLGNNIYIPLAVVEPSSMISTEEAMKYLNGGGGLEEEIYVKGRYSGKRLFNLMYIPAYAVTIKQKFGS
jgi:hypothetical protein